MTGKTISEFITHNNPERTAQNDGGEQRGFPVIDVILAILLFVKIATCYMDYRKHGQFEWTPVAILFGCLIFALTCPLYIWTVVSI